MPLCPPEREGQKLIDLTFIEGQIFVDLQRFLSGPIGFRICLWSGSMCSVQSLLEIIAPLSDLAQ